jgi:hypothetical protein
MGDFSDGPPIYDPKTTSQPELRSSRPASPTNPQLIRSQFLRQRHSDGAHQPCRAQRASAICAAAQPYEGMDMGMGTSMGGTFNNYLDTRARSCRTIRERFGSTTVGRTAACCSADTR